MSLRGLTRRLVPATVALAALGLAAPVAQAATPRGHEVKVMTRNLYLGADLGPAISAPGAPAFIKANGEILRQVDANKFPVRAKGLAQEIASQKPDIVGLQEVSLWRDGPVDFNAALNNAPVATHVVYDYLASLMAELAKRKAPYRVSVVQPQFDFEAPADYDGNAATGFLGADKNGRLTMRDVILERTNSGVKVENATSGQFQTLYTPTVANTVVVPVKRGWTAVDVKVRGTKAFRLVNTHLEAFGDDTIREAQARELFAAGGPAARRSRPVVLIGDLNSDDDTVFGGDRLAYQALLDAGFVARSTANPLSCCLGSDILTADQGSLANFDHQVDHVMTDSPGAVRLVSSVVTGLTPVNGYWNSDHAGVTSTLLFSK